MAIEKSVEMVLKIKPVYVHLIHRTPYMGPCRYGEGEQLERAYDEMMMGLTPERTTGFIPIWKVLDRR